jgi:hypothetical protein
MPFIFAVAGAFKPDPICSFDADANGFVELGKSRNLTN